MKIKEKATDNQIDFVLSTIIQENEKEYFWQCFKEEDYIVEDVTQYYKDNPEMLFKISVPVMVEIQKWYNSEAFCAGWICCFPISSIYDFITRTGGKDE